MAVGHGPESSGIYGVRKEVDQLGEIVVRHERVGSREEFEPGGVGREDLAEGADLFGRETFGFEYFICGLDAVIILAGIEHPYPEFVDIVVGGKGVTVRIDEGQV